MRRLERRGNELFGRESGLCEAEDESGEIQSFRPSEPSVRDGFRGGPVRFEIPLRRCDGSRD